MKALSLTQPWASALFIKLPNGAPLKGIETRSWQTSFKGRVAIHASKGFPKYAREFADEQRALGRIPGKLPFGGIIGFVTIIGMRLTQDIVGQISPTEKLYGDYSPGRFAWMLYDAEPLYPAGRIVECRGSLGLWRVPDRIIEELGGDI